MFYLVFVESGMPLGIVAVFVVKFTLRALKMNQVSLLPPLHPKPIEGTLGPMVSTAIYEALEEPLSFIRRRVPLLLTLRGLLCVAVILYLISGPVSQQSDIVASVLSFSLLGVLVLLGTVTFLKGRSLRRWLSVDVSVVSAGEPASATAGERTALLIKLSPCRVPPFFTLELRISFEEGEIVVPVSQFEGGSKVVWGVREPITFPHRGIWSLRSVQCQLIDRLGLCSFEWEKGDVGGPFAATLPQIFEDSLPILSSSHRAGDILAHANERLGDPFDMKPYHPSDGLRRILWKVYAKTGELVARHAESAVTPEGQVVVFCFANRREDDVAAGCLAYLRRLESLDLSIFFGCEGLSDGVIARSSIEAERDLLRSVWNTPADYRTDLKQQFVSLIEGFQRCASNSSITRVIIFCGASRLGDDGVVPALMELGIIVEQYGGTPVFVIRGRDRLDKPSDSSIPWWISRVLFVRSPTIHRGTSKDLAAFSSVCISRRWEVLV